MLVNIPSTTGSPPTTDDRTTIETTTKNDNAFNVSTGTMVSTCPEVGDLIMSKINGTQSQGHSNNNRSTLSTGEHVYVTDYVLKVNVSLTQIPLSYFADM